MTIKCIRISTGEDIIGDVSTTANGIVIKNPAQITIQSGADGRVGAAFLPFLPFAESNTATFYTHGVIGECDIDIHLQNEYNRIFGSGIVVANTIPK